MKQTNASNGSFRVNGHVDEKLRSRLRESVHDGQASSSKTMPVRRARMIHVQKLEDSSDSSSSDNVTNLVGNRASSLNCSFISNKSSNGTGEVAKNARNGSKRSKNDLNKEIVERIEDSEDLEEDKEDSENIEEAKEGSGNMDESEKGSEDSDEGSDESAEGEDSDESDSEERNKPSLVIEPKIINTKSINGGARKTVKVLYPKIIKGGSNNVSMKVVPRNSSPLASCELSKRKYPLRQTAKRCLAELSSEESDTSARYKTRRTSQRVQNGFSTYAEQSENELSDDDSEEDEHVNEEDNDVDDDESECYQPPPAKVPGRGCKRRISSDSTGGSRKGISQQVRKSIKTRGRRSQNNARNNSESEDSQEWNHSDNEEKPAISVSSRGRVRKLTARARALLKD